MNQYAEEAKERWGSTDEYKECARKTAAQTVEEQKRAGEEMMLIFAEFGKIKTRPANDIEAQNLAEKLQRFITEHYYNCTAEIFRSLGQIYTADERFKANIDGYGGAGTAEFVSRAVEIYCDNSV